eukprot:14395105-Alexandrium_andersonii.AAC.1
MSQICLLHLSWHGPCMHAVAQRISAAFVVLRTPCTRAVLHFDFRRIAVARKKQLRIASAR